MSFQGVRTSGWTRPSSFFDVDNQIPPTIASEMMLNEKPPVQYHLRLKKNAKPGEYNVIFNFTYFNGAEWKSAVARVDYKVRNYVQKHELLTTVFGIIAAVATIGSLVATALFQIFPNNNVEKAIYNLQYQVMEISSDTESSLIEKNKLLIQAIDNLSKEKQDNN